MGYELTHNIYSGAFFRSCKPCSVKLNGSASDDHVTLNLGCNCKDVKGHTPATILDLSQYTSQQQ